MRSVRAIHLRARLRSIAAASTLLLLCGCASYAGHGLKPGESTLADVRARMGEPAWQWTAPDSSMLLSYPRGPAGFQSYMVRVDPAGRVQDVQNVMDQAHFNRITRGMDELDVLKILGPSVPEWGGYFPARRERVWEWRFCSEFGQASRFDVLFDADRHNVRGTMSRVEECGVNPCLCAR